MEWDVVEIEVDFEKDQEGADEIPQAILNEVAKNLNERQGREKVEPAETLFATFLQSLVSDKMDLDLGEDYEDRVQDMVDELEESGREAGFISFPSREIKEELIKKKEVSRESRKTGDGKVSSDSTEETERIMIEDSNEESYTIKRVTQQDEDEPDPHGEVPTPVSESTPYDGHEKRAGKMNFRPLTAPKKQMWVQPESREVETDEEDRKNSDNESPASRRSPMSVISSGRMIGLEHEVPLHLRSLGHLVTGPPGPTLCSMIEQK